MTKYRWRYRSVARDGGGVPVLGARIEGTQRLQGSWVEKDLDAARPLRSEVPRLARSVVLPGGHQLNDHDEWSGLPGSDDQVYLESSPLIGAELVVSGGFCVPSPRRV